MKNDLLILGAQEVTSLLKGRELELIQIVQMAYEAHSKGASSLPQSTFLRFPFNKSDRIIALPAYLGGEFNIAGLKWISSFPDNLSLGLDRASAVLIINSLETGRPEAIIEGSIVSAKRTAASAALAAQYLQRDAPSSIGFIGCGIINFEIARFLLAIYPNIENFFVYDINPDRSDLFKERCQNTFEGIKVECVKDINQILSQNALISIATTAVEPYIFSLSECVPGSVILHISLRDIAPEVILACDNVVDDIDHVCRAQTSIHLAENIVSHRDFIRCTLADILTGAESARKDKTSTVVFSPFGLGILDVAVGKLLKDMATLQNQGSLISSFLPESWVRNQE